MLISIGTGLKALRREREAEIARLAQRAPGGKPPPTSQKEQERLTIEVSGTVHPILVLGVDDPDNPDIDFYVP